jgi:hypothetical protein
LDLYQQLAAARRTASLSTARVTGKETAPQCVS